MGPDYRLYDRVVSTNHTIIMTTEAQSAAQHSLAIMEQELLGFPIDEQMEIRIAQAALRRMIELYNSSAEYAILMMSFEIAIKEKQ